MAELLKAEPILSTLNDETIVLEEGDHIYKLILPDGVEIVANDNVSDFTDHLFGRKKPNLNLKADQMARGRTYINNPRYSFISPQCDTETAKSKILDYWNIKKEEARQGGADMQSMIATFYRTGEHLVNPVLTNEQNQFKQFLLQGGRNLQPIGIQLKIFDRILLLAGTVHALFMDKTTGRYVLVDWKRIEVDDLRRRPKPGKYGCVNANQKINKYEMRCNVYADILNMCYNIQVSAMYLWIFNTGDPTGRYVFHEVTVNPLVVDEMKRLRVKNE